MHSGFASLRGQIPMNIRATGRDVAFNDESKKDIARILEIWTDCRSRFGRDGRFLFGGLSAADAMFAPIVSRFLTYGIQLEDVTADYVDAVWNCEHMKWWRAASADEPWTIPGEEVGLK